MKQNIQGHPVLIIGGGRGGTALLEMFVDDKLVRVIAVVDSNPNAPGLQLARHLGIPTFTNASEALQACKDHSDCIVYNLSHDDSIAREASKVFGDNRVASGHEVKLFWQIVMNIKQTKEALKKSQDQLQAIIHNAMDGIITIAETGEIQGFNPAAEQIFGYSQQEILGRNVSLLMPEPHCGEHDNYIRRYLRTGQTRIIGISGREVVAVKKSGDHFPIEMSISEMVLGGSRYFVGIVRDITERKLAEQKIAHLAHHDYLTNLPNRALFLNNLEQSLLLADRNSLRVAILFLDLDGFKQVNDTLGHDAGDLLLQEVALRLKKVVRASDTVARVGGDEFNFVLNDIESGKSAALIAEKVLAALAEPFDLKGRQCHIGGSIGISIFPDDSDDLMKLIKQADSAMYLAKHSGKNNYKYFSETLPK